MFTTNRTVLSASVLSAAVLALALGASTAEAQTAYKRDTGSQRGGQPLLGFSGHIEYGWGMMVDRVRRGSPADRMGLERGDVVVRINDQRIRSYDDYYTALRSAEERVRVQIDDVRGRGLIWDSCYISRGRGPTVAACER